MPRALRSRMLGLVLAAMAGSLAIATGGCGDDGVDEKKAPVKPPAPRIAGRFECPQYVFNGRARPATKRFTVAGKQLSGGRDYLVVVRIQLVNRTRRSLRVGQMKADLRDLRGRSYEPIFADGREATDPSFAETTVAPSRSIDAELVYRLPVAAIVGADLRVTDPLRKQSFELSVY